MQACILGDRDDGPAFLLMLSIAAAGFSVDADGAGSNAGGAASCDPRLMSRMQLVLTGSAVPARAGVLHTLPVFCYSTSMLSSSSLQQLTISMIT